MDLKEILDLLGEEERELIETLLADMDEANAFEDKENSFIGTIIRKTQENYVVTQKMMQKYRDSLPIGDKNV